MENKTLYKITNNQREFASYASNFDEVYLYIKEREGEIPYIHVYGKFDEELQRRVTIFEYGEKDDLYMLDSPIKNVLDVL